MNEKFKYMLFGILTGLVIAISASLFIITGITADTDRIINNYKERIADAQRLSAEAEGIIADLTGKLDREISRVDDLVNTATELRSRLVESNRNLTEARNRIAELEGIFDSFTDGLSTATEYNEDIEAVIDSLIRRIDSLILAYQSYKTTE